MIQIQVQDSVRVPLINFLLIRSHSANGKNQKIVQTIRGSKK